MGEVVSEVVSEVASDEQLRGGIGARCYQNGRWGLPRFGEREVGREKS